MSLAACDASDFSVEMADDITSDITGDIMDGITESIAPTITKNGLKFIQIEIGDGPKPEVGQWVQVHYTGKLVDGTEFDSSAEREPFTFQMGEAQVIAGWEEGIAMLNEGGKAMLIIPPELAYGSAGAGDGLIPPAATLLFTMELVNIIEEPVIATPTEVDDDAYTETRSGLKYFDIEVGDGEAARPGSVVSVHYTGWLAIDNTKFDSSFDRNTPLTFALGKGQVIDGWEEGLSTMRVGGKRQLLIPSELAYDNTGYGNGIPPDATLKFDVELVRIIEKSPASPTLLRNSDYTETDSGLQYYDFEIGEGDTPKAGDLVDVHYTGWLADGTKFDSSLDRWIPLSFEVGADQVIAGWEEGIRTMQIGGKRQLILPPHLAYGSVGANDVVPADETLIFEIELIDIRKE